MSDYEKTRQVNIARNRALLESLGLDKPVFEPKAKPGHVKKKASNTPKKRKAEEEDVDASTPKTKVQRTRATADVFAATAGVRRSQRNVGRSVDYTAERVDRGPVPIAIQSGVRGVENEGPLGRGAGSKRIHDPKQFGSIPGIKVGTWWETREGCSADAIHAPWVAGIAPSKQGAFSVALSGGYDDDVDLGYAFTYTGSGGRDLKGTKTNPKNLRTAPQSSNQTFDNNFNQALFRSVETKKPVRVIRGFKLKSPHAPSEGYRYDGLYKVEKAWREIGLEGYLVCKYAFKRLDGQPPLPVQGESTAESDEQTVAPEEEEDNDNDGNDSIESEGDEGEDGEEEGDTSPAVDPSATSASPPAASETGASADEDAEADTAVADEGA